LNVFITNLGVNGKAYQDWMGKAGISKSALISTLELGWDLNLTKGAKSKVRTLPIISLKILMAGIFYEIITTVGVAK